MKDRDFEIIDVKERVFNDNDKKAAEVRRDLDRTGTFFVNLMSSPGAGKTTTLVRTIRALKGQYRIGVIEADVDSDVDAVSVEEAGARVIQVHTGGACHMDAEMTKEGLEKMGTEGLDLVFLENVGNLVCPAEFDVGSDLKVCILSLPEGDDKPLKYPLMFKVADLLLINKIDAAPAFDFDLERAKKNAREKNPGIRIIPVSAATGEGFDAWISILTEEIEKKKKAKEGTL